MSEGRLGLGMPSLCLHTSIIAHHSRLTNGTMYSIYMYMSVSDIGRYMCTLSLHSVDDCWYIYNRNLLTEHGNMYMYVCITLCLFVLYFVFIL